MGYKIFSARKCQLTNLKNNAYADMMLKWNEQTQLGDDKVEAMDTNNDKTTSENTRYSNEKNSIFADYDNQINSKYASITANNASINSNNDQISAYKEQQTEYGEGDNEYKELQTKIDALETANTNLTNNNTTLNNDISQLTGTRDRKLSNAQTNHDNNVQQNKSEYDRDIQDLNNAETKLEKPNSEPLNTYFRIYSGNVKGGAAGGYGNQNLYPELQRCRRWKRLINTDYIINKKSLKKLFFIVYFIHIPF